MFHSLSPTLHPILFPSTTLYSILVYNLSSALLRRCYRSVFSVVQTFSLPLQLNTSRCNHTRRYVLSVAVFIEQRVRLATSAETRASEPCEIFDIRRFPSFGSLIAVCT